jgi:hypothetical protein
MYRFATMYDRRVSSAMPPSHRVAQPAMEWRQRIIFNESAC